MNFVHFAKIIYQKHFQIRKSNNVYIYRDEEMILQGYVRQKEEDERYVETKINPADGDTADHTAAGLQTWEERAGTVGDRTE